ncbi:hypothetical protein KQ236_13600, partial [Lactococcus lactis]|nr:hypothetical protein [Lactococcus lactis]
MYSLAKTHSADGGLKEDLVIVDRESSNGSTAVGYSKMVIITALLMTVILSWIIVMDVSSINVMVNKKTIRNYRYKMKVLNSGGKYFGGYHFVESALSLSREVFIST